MGHSHRELSKQALYEISNIRGEIEAPYGLGRRIRYRSRHLVFTSILCGFFCSNGFANAASQDAIPRNALRYRDDLIREARFIFGLKTPISMFASQIQVESGWNPNAASKFANGLAQFTPATADWINGAFKLSLVPQPTNPQWAIRALLRYDNKLHDEVVVFDKECDRWSFALSDYNGGSSRRRARQRLSSFPGSYEKTRTINPGISASNQRENEVYPNNIIYRWQPVYINWGTTWICEGDN